MVRSMLWSLAVLALTVAAPFALAANTLPERYFDSMTTLRAEFSQTVYDANDQVIEDSTGTMMLQKPGRFRWDYATPFPQLIVADGERLWHFDRDLDQVTVKGMDEVLSSAPMALLTEGKPLAQSFHVRVAGVDSGLRWFELEPVSPAETEFQSLRIAFLDDGGLAAMELRDFLDQRTVLHFRNVERDIALDPALFRFVPPPGADVLGDNR